MSLTIDPIEGTLTPIRDRVLVSDMYFGEQKTKAGLIITSDDGNVRGIYPRWGRVHAKGPENNDPYQVGDWILIEHGRWTRGVVMKNGDETVELRMVENSSILMYSDVKPDGVVMGKQSVADFAPESNITPESFIRG